MTTIVSNRRLVRTSYGDYKVHLSARISHEAHVFFLNHEESKEAAEALHSSPTRARRPDEEEEEAEGFTFEQTRGGTFKIVPPEYFFHDETKPKPHRQVYRENLPNYGRNNPNITEDDFDVEPGSNHVRGRLVPCTYRFG